MTKSDRASVAHMEQVVQESLAPQAQMISVKGSGKGKGSGAGRGRGKGNGKGSCKG
jgi:hypothetical protein